MNLCSPKLSIYREIKQQKSGNFALPEPCISGAVPFGMLAHQCSPQTWVTETLHSPPSFYTLTASQLPFALVCCYFCFSEGTVENGEDHKNVVLLYQDSRSGLCREHSAWLSHRLRSRIPHCPAAPVLLFLLPHTQAKREQNMFFFSFFLSCPQN